LAAGRATVARADAFAAAGTAARAADVPAADVAPTDVPPDFAVARDALADFVPGRVGACATAFPEALPVALPAALGAGLAGAFAAALLADPAGAFAAAFETGRAATARAGTAGRDAAFGVAVRALPAAGLRGVASDRWVVRDVVRRVVPFVVSALLTARPRWVNRENL